MGYLVEWMNKWTETTQKQNRMVFGVLNNREQKMDLKWNAECDDIDTDCSGNQNKMEKEYGLEQDMEWKIEWNGKMEWNAKWQYLMAYRIKEKCYMRKGMKWRIVCSIV